MKLKYGFILALNLFMVCKVQASEDLCLRFEISGQDRFKIADEISSVVDHEFKGLRLSRSNQETNEYISADQVSFDELGKLQEQGIIKSLECQDRTDDFGCEYLKSYLILIVDLYDNSDANNSYLMERLIEASNQAQNANLERQRALSNYHPLKNLVVLHTTDQCDFNYISLE